MTDELKEVWKLAALSSHFHVGPEVYNKHETTTFGLQVEMRSQDFLNTK